MSKLLTFVISSCLIVLFICSPALSQTATATLSGTILDQNGALVPGVSVTVQNTATAFERTATTNESGAFSVPLLPPGTYIVTAKRDGFAAVQVRDVVLNVADQKSLAIQLRVGDVNSTVDVTGEASLVRTDPAVSSTIDRTFLRNLPLNGRSFQSLILLTPGVVLTPSFPGSPGQFSVNGQRSNANYFTVDGVGANAAAGTTLGAANTGSELAGAVPALTSFGGTNALVSVDALEEFKIQTSSYSAQYGRQPGGQVQLITRSGTNQFHGSVFEYLRNDALDANDWFDNALARPHAPLRQNQFGGTFSGPVFIPPFYKGRDRTFFFFSYEGLRLFLPASIDTYVPSVRLRDAAAVSIRPILRAYPLPTGDETLSDHDFDPTTPPILSGVSPYTAVFSNPSSLNATSIRVDHVINKQVSLFGRYSDAPSKSLIRGLGKLTGSDQRTSSLTVGAILSPAANFSNDFRFNYTVSRGAARTEGDELGGAVPVELSVLTSGYSGPGVKGGVAVFSFPGSPITGDIVLGDDVRSYQRQFNFVDNVTWAVDSHRLQFGLDFRKLLPIYGPRAYSQGTTFRSQDDVISGTATEILITASQEVRPVFDNISLYVQDDWKVSRRLSLNLGLRWEINPAPYDSLGKKPVLVVGVDDLPNAELAPADASIYETVKTAFAPRFGAAFQLRRKPGSETVIRGGFGFYYDLGSSLAAAGFSGYPFDALTLLENQPFPLSPALAVPPSFPPVGLPITDTISAINPNLKPPYSMQWNIAFQQSLGRDQSISLSYVGSAARQLLTTQLLNSPRRGPVPNPNFGGILFRTNGPTSDYRSLQLQYQRRLSSGLQAVANYSWSRAVDEVSDEIATLDPTNKFVRGNSNFDIRHNFSLGVTYQLPKLHAGAFLNFLFNNWEIDSIVLATSGRPTNVTVGNFVLPNGNTGSVRADVVPGVPFWIEDDSVAGGKRLNPAAFALPPPDPLGGVRLFARQGTLPRNEVRLPGLLQINSSLRRRFKLRDELSLELALEVFNVPNHPQFDQYDTFFRLPLPSGFGKARSALNKSLGGLSSLYQVGGPRSIQLSARLSF